MIWIIVIVAVLVGANFLLKSGGKKTIRNQMRETRGRLQDEPPEQQAKVASEIRATANTGYQRLFDAAKQHGKDDAFAHQSGVLQALQDVSAPGRRLHDHEHQALVVEGVPFNKLEPEAGRRAVTEYLVWKFLPEQSDETAFGPALRRFRDEVMFDAKSEDRPDEFTFGLLYSMKYEWQRWLSEHRDQPVA